MGLGQVRPGALLRPGEVAGPELDVGLAREPLGHRRVVMEVEAHHDLVLLSHSFPPPAPHARRNLFVARTAHRAQAGPRRPVPPRSRPRPPPACFPPRRISEEASGLFTLQRLTFGKYGRDSEFSLRKIRMFASLAAMPEHSAAQAAMAGGELAHEHPLPGDPPHRRRDGIARRGGAATEPRRRLCQRADTHPGEGAGCAVADQAWPRCRPHASRRSRGRRRRRGARPRRRPPPRRPGRPAERPATGGDDPVRIAEHHAQGAPGDGDAVRTHRDQGGARAPLPTSTGCWSAATSTAP